MPHRVRVPRPNSEMDRTRENLLLVLVARGWLFLLVLLAFRMRLHGQRLHRAARSLVVVWRKRDFGRLTRLLWLGRPNGPVGHLGVRGSGARRCGHHLLLSRYGSGGHRLLSRLHRGGGRLGRRLSGWHHDGWRLRSLIIYRFKARLRRRRDRKSTRLNASHLGISYAV